MPDRSRNTEGDGIFVQATEARAGWSLHVIHKIGGQLYDRNLQYEVFAFRQDQNRPSYYWDGVLTKDRNVLMTGHLWLNAHVWLYNEYVSFRGRKPTRKIGDAAGDVSANRLRALFSLLTGFPTQRILLVSIAV